MDDAVAQLNTVIDVFERLGANLRKERLGGSGGGLCLVRGERVLFIDLDADPATQLDRCLTALSTIPEIDSMYLVPALRERIDCLRASRTQVREGPANF